MLKPLVVTIFLLAAAGDAVAGCADAATVRVRFINCKLTKHVVRINGYDVVLRQVDAAGDPDYYEGRVGGPITPAYAIEGIAGSPTVCCTAPPRLIPKENDKPGCYLEYVIACDDRAAPWGLTASSGTKDVKFAFEPDHPDDYGQLACVPQAAQVAGNRVSGLGENDWVRFELLRNDVPLVSGLLVKLSSFKDGVYPLSRKKLEERIDELVRERHRGAKLSDPEKYLVDSSKAKLPKDGVVVEKQR